MIVLNTQKLFLGAQKKVSDWKPAPRHHRLHGKSQRGRPPPFLSHKAIKGKPACQTPFNVLHAYDLASFPHSLELTGEETESQRGRAPCSRSQAGGGRGWMTKSASSQA